MDETPLRLAVVGAGVAGLTAAWLLQRRHQVTVLEQNDDAGGHTNTVSIPDGPDAGTPVDTGFIVLNDRNYPTFTRLLQQLGVAVRTADMSFGYHDRPSGLCYSTHDANRLFAQRRNLLDPRFLRLVADLLRFNRGGDPGPEVTLREYCRRKSYSRFFQRHYLTAIGASVWSTPAEQMLDFPARSLRAFFRNHGMLSLTDRPVWQTIPGGSQTYVRRMRMEVRTQTRVAAISRHPDQVLVDGQPFDGVILACHADQALRLLQDPSPDERRLLSPWTYHRNRTVLHTDLSLMPPERRAWASWNFTRQRPEEPVFISYHMNRLQGLCTHHQYLVTLNRPDPYPEGSVVAAFDYEHPAYTRDSVATQAELPGLNGRNRTWFCGSYFGYGFHEDAVKSAVDLATSLGCPL